MKNSKQLTDAAVLLVLDRLEDDWRDRPEWPVDVVYGASLVSSESGQLVRFALDYHQERATRDAAVRVAASALRFIINSFH